MECNAVQRTHGGEIFPRYTTVFTIITLINACFSQVVKPESAELFEHLLNSSRYSPDVIPLCGNQSRVTVRLGTAVRDIVEMMETHQVIRLNIWVRLTWTDCMLTWDPILFNNQTEIVFPYNKIWTPDIFVFEGISDEGNMPGLEDYRAFVTYKGEVSYSFPTVITSVCRVRVTYFPFDHQVCNLTFGSWVYSGRLLQWEPDGDSSDISTFKLHNEWDLVRTKAIKRVFYYQCCTDPYPDIRLHIHLRRKPTFNMVTIIFPCFVVTSLTVVGFFLPPTSGEKIALQMTVLLSLSVFLVLLQDKLPSDSDHIPFLASYFSISMLLVCLACLMSGIVTHVHYRSPAEHRMSDRIRSLFLIKLRRLLKIEIGCGDFVKAEIIVKKFSHPYVYSLSANELHELCMKQSKQTMVDVQAKVSETGMPEIDPEPQGERRLSKQFCDQWKSEKDNREIQDIVNSTLFNEWEILAIVLDRVFMYIYVGLNVLNSIVMLATMISYDGSDQII